MDNPKYKFETDETLVALTLLGKTIAYEKLVVRYQNTVINRAQHITGSRFMAEDAAQDAFVSAWLKLDKLRDPSKFGAWVCRIAQNYAKNMLIKYRDNVSLEELEGLEYETGAAVFESHDQSENIAELHDSISKLPEKVGNIIRLHYFEGLSIAEIAARMLIPEGTVKWHLSEGRKKLRKELGEMNENNTFVKRVMEKVEELKLWRLKKNTEGLREAYEDLLRDIDKMPESHEKSSALADTLKIGWWNFSDTHSDELFERMKQAALDSRNEEVMDAVALIEFEKVPKGKERIEFMRDKLLPWLKENNFRKAQGSVWYWLAYECFEIGESENGFSALENVTDILTPADVYYSNAISAKRGETYAKGRSRNDLTFHINTVADEFRYIDGELRFWSQPGYRIGGYYNYDEKPNYLFYNIARCDRYLFPSTMKPGDMMTSQSGEELKYISDSETIETPCGTFEGCILWQCKTEKYTYRTWCKPDIGIVRADTISDDKTEVRTLKEYTIIGGKGMVPYCAGNRWVYGGDYNGKVIDFELIFEVTHADDFSVIFNYDWHIERKGYDENDWEDMVHSIKHSYVVEENGSEKLADASHNMECAIKAAKTPYEKTYALIMSDVLNRIYATDTDYNPNATEKGYRNFFSKLELLHDSGRIKLDFDWKTSFEWKDRVSGAGVPLLFNGVYEILDYCIALYDEKWKPGYSDTVNLKTFGDDITTQIACEEVPSVTTPAGTFENCLIVKTDTAGFKGGMSYIGGKMEYYFAPNIGIVRAVSHFANGDSCTYDLTEYKGTGEGMMPIADGMFRRYEAQGLKEGFVGKTEYTYCEHNGKIYIFQNKTGVKKLK